jgi:hypothetical protein
MVQRIFARPSRAPTDSKAEIGIRRPPAAGCLSSPRARQSCRSRTPHTRPGIGS